MAEQPNIAHRPGLFKLPSKKHKTGQHRSKRAVERDNRGKMGVKTLSMKRNIEMSKAQRRHQLKQQRLNKLENLLERFRMEGGSNRSPYLTTILSLDPNAKSQEIMENLLKYDIGASFTKSEWSDIYCLNVERFKGRYCFLCPQESETGSLRAILDSLKVSDTLMILWPSDEIISEEAEFLLMTLMAQGLPATLHIVTGLPTKGKQRDQKRKNLEKSMERWGMANDKIHSLEDSNDALKILRLISSMKKTPTVLQQRRPHLLVDKLAFGDAINNEVGTLKVSGYLRGTPLNADNLVHIQGWGDFRLSAVDIEPTNNRQIAKITLTPSTTTSDLDKSFAQQHINPTSNVIGDEEMQSVFSEESSEDEEEVSEDEENMEKESTCGGTDADSMSYTNQDVEFEEEDGEHSTNLDEAEKFKQMREDAQWPDEVETPDGVPARKRFQKYRGLKSFRTSPWDPKENLPENYNRIFKFLNFKQTKKIVLSGIKKSFVEATKGPELDEPVKWALPGAYVTLHISNVPIAASEELKRDQPFIIFGLLPHEDKMAVLNLVLKKHPSCHVPIRNKQNLIFQIGYRRFEAGALFSQHNNGNKFKMERWMPAEGNFCASLYAPIMFPPATVLVFRRDAKGREKLVATGIVLDLNSDRVVLKRIVLTGHPYRVQKRFAVVRYMFQNKEDVEWFKPVELYTPKGRHGHIKESLGTKGLMKCHFDQPLTTQDAVMLNLYKRVFPKWTYSARVIAPLQATVGGSSRRPSLSEDLMEE